MPASKSSCSRPPEGSARGRPGSGGPEAEDLRTGRAHALPVGVGDHPPEHAEPMRGMEEALLQLLRRHGYRLIETPTVERYDTLSAGLSGEAETEVFHLVDPETGEPLILRPDLTPQVARHIAAHPPRHLPVRLAYSGKVFRVTRRPGSAPRERRQTGAEIIGWHGVEADVEVVDVALRCLHAVAAGLRTVLVLGDVAVLQAIIDALGLPEGPARGRVLRALARKGYDDVLRRVEASGGDPKLAARLPELTGPPDALAGWMAQSWPAPVHRALEDFALRVQRLRDPPFAGDILLDLAELRDRRYYTGIIFEAFAEGSGVPVLAGGRYDRFLGRFGLQLPAAGFAVDRDGLRAAGAGAVPAPVVAVRRESVATDATRAGRVLDAIRAAGHDAAQWPPGGGHDLPARVDVGARKISWTLDGKEGAGSVHDLLAALTAWSQSRRPTP